VPRRIALQIAATGLALAAALLVWSGAGFALYADEYIWRMLRWRDSEVGDYLHNFRSDHLQPPRARSVSNTQSTRNASRQPSRRCSRVDDFEAFLSETDTRR
jgi:hypothetical protein